MDNITCKTILQNKTYAKAILKDERSVEGEIIQVNDTCVIVDAVTGGRVSVKVEEIIRLYCY